MQARRGKRGGEDGEVSRGTGELRVFGGALVCNERVVTIRGEGAEVNRWWVGGDHAEGCRLIDSGLICRLLEVRKEPGYANAARLYIPTPLILMTWPDVIAPAHVAVQ